MNKNYVVLILLWLSPLAAMTKKPKPPKMTFSRCLDYFTARMTSFGPALVQWEADAVTTFNLHIGAVQETITRTCNGPRQVRYQQKSSLSAPTISSLEEQELPTSTTPTVFVPEPKGFFPADGQEEPLPQQPPQQDKETEALLVLFMTKSPQYAPAFLKFCAKKQPTINLKVFVQELEKSEKAKKELEELQKSKKAIKSPDSQPPQ